MYMIKFIRFYLNMQFKIRTETTKQQSLKTLKIQKITTKKNGTEDFFPCSVSSVRW